MLRKILLFIFILAIPFTSQCKLPELTPKLTHSKLNEIMKSHAVYNTLTPLIVKRTLTTYLEELDPTKCYFTESDIQSWIDPAEATIDRILDDFNHQSFKVFEEIHEAMTHAIHHRHELEKQIREEDLPAHVNAQEFKDMKWTKSDDELLTRLTRIKALQIEAASKLTDEFKEKSLQRIAKRQTKYEDDILLNDPAHRQKMVLSNTLKAFTSALDSHTSYFTPDEATQFMINVQQRLFGIGAQLRDDINGFSVIKIIEGGPAASGKELKAKDRIIAVNGEPVVGMDISDAVELIRGEENTPVILTVIRETLENEVKNEEKLDISIKRGEVVLKETRYESSHEPFGDSAIGYLRLHSFYQDPDSSSATDLEKAIQNLKEEHRIKGLILDLRYNSGGLLSQAVNVAGLFITKGIVVSIKDETGSIQHLRELEGKTAWDGPLIVLVNRASASASEIVAGTLQDYGRAVIVGDDHTYGKGTFQTFTLNSTKNGAVNPEGEYKVTRGIYYTVSGKSPQLTGVQSDLVIPGALSETEIGEKFSKYPLENNSIAPNFKDDLSDISFFQRSKVRLLYKFNLQEKIDIYQPYLAKLKENLDYRINHNKDYQNFLKEIKKKDPLEEDEEDPFGQNDLQLIESYNLMKDLILLMN